MFWSFEVSPNIFAQTKLDASGENDIKLNGIPVEAI